MKTWIKRAIAVMVAATVFSLPALMAQGRGGGGQRGAGQGRAQTPGAGPQAGQMGKGQTQRDQTQDRDRLRQHVTDQQRDQFRTCTQEMERLQTQARTMAQVRGGKEFNADDARSNRQQLQDRFQAMQQEHQRMMQGLNDEQRTAVQQRTQQMDRLQTRMQTRLQDMDKELNGATPSANRIREQARLFEREMNRLQREHRDMGEDLAFD